jgi:hypothetical protein
MDRGEAEGFTMSQERDLDNVYLYIFNLARDAVSIPQVDMRTKRIVFRSLDPATLSIIKSLQYLHGLKPKEVERRIQEGTAEGNEIAQKLTQAVEEPKKGAPKETEGEELEEGGE